MGDQEVKAMLMDCGYSIAFIFRGRAYRVQTPPAMRQMLDAEWAAKQAHEHMKITATT
jgi:hypothetical protein